MPFRTQHGLTLIEMLVAMAVGSLVLAGIYGTFVQQQRVYTLQDHMVRMQQNARIGMALMVNEIRMAGFDPTESGGMGIQAGDSENFTGPQSIRFTRDTKTPVSPDSNDCIDVPNGQDNDCDEDITYRLYDPDSDGDLTLGRKSVNSVNIQPVIENVASLDFCYFLQSAPNGPCTPTPAAAELDQIRSIQITLTTQTENPDPKYTHPQNGTHYRTTTLTAVVQVRNLGLKRS
jgi:type IV pilus assembly protein PilW